MTNKNACEHPRCTKRARYWLPKSWCGEHWRAWWNWPIGRREPKWMGGALDDKAKEATG